MFAPVYLDHNATTPLDERVLEGMLPYLRTQYGNASSRHEYGRAARRAIDEARQRVAWALGAHPTEVIFTSGGSEANNLWVKGVAAMQKPGTLLLSAIEHPCVREPARQLLSSGWAVREVAVDADGRIDRADYDNALKTAPALVSIMLANNETGVVQDIARLASAAREQSGRSWFHSDAVQALGKMALNFRDLNAQGVHALTVSAHKIGGPKGAGALVADKRVELAPLIAGGGHERGLRSGTENVAAIVGFGLAVELAVHDLPVESVRVRVLQNSLESALAELGATVFGKAAGRLPNTAYFAFPGIDGETLVGRLDRAGFAVASGAACSSSHRDVSPVLQAMGVDAGLARGAVRVSLGATNTAAQMDGFMAALSVTLAELRGLRSVSV